MELSRDLRIAGRRLRRNPAFAAVAVLTIALGLGANTAIFSVVRAVLLRPLPYAAPERLVVIAADLPNRGIEDFPLSPPDFRDLREQTRLLEDVAAVVTFAVPITGEGEPEQVQAAAVTPNFAGLLGVRPFLGRDFTEEDAAPVPPDAQPGANGVPPNTVILSHELWQRRFGGDPGLLGRTVDLGGNPALVVGVMPAGFRLLSAPTSGLADRVDAWLPLRVDYAAAPRGNVFLRVVGRLREGVSIPQAQAEMDGVSARMREEFWSTTGLELKVEGMHENLTSGVRPMVLTLLGAVGFLLLIACANVSNLLLVRATAREREIAVRSALGAARGRLVRELLVEAGVLALLGGLLGLVLAHGGIRLLLLLQPEDLPRLESIAIDGPVLGFTALSVLVAALAFGLLPALNSSRPDLAESLRDRSGASRSPGQRLLRDGVVVAEVALSLVLLVGAGLMLRSFVALQSVDPGFEAEGRLTFTLNVPGARYPTPAEQMLLRDQMRERIAALPGVLSVSGGLPLPLTGQPFNGRYGTPDALQDESLYRQAAYRVVFPGYFETMGTRLIEGRVFSAAEHQDSSAVAVVDRVLAARLWPGESAVGKRLIVRVTNPTDPEEMEVIGVVEHQRAQSLSEEGPETVYFTDRYVGAFGATWVVHTGGDPMALVRSIQREVAAIDPGIPVGDVRTMEDYVSEATAPTRFALVLIGVFGVTALILAGVGLYGVLAYVVRQRGAEIGVRIALGASTRSVLGMVLRQGMALAVLGLAIGLGASLALTRFLEGMLVGVAPTDPTTFAAISLLFLGIAASAALLPALRAARIDPARILREE